MTEAVNPGSAGCLHRKDRTAQCTEWQAGQPAATKPSCTRESFLSSSPAARSPAQLLQLTSQGTWPWAQSSGFCTLRAFQGPASLSQGSSSFSFLKSQQGEQPLDPCLYPWYLSPAYIIQNALNPRVTGIDLFFLETRLWGEKKSQILNN